MPPSTPIIVEKHQGLVRGADVGPFEIGGSLVVTCKVFGGIINNALNIFRWFSSAKLYFSRFSSSIGDLVEGWERLRRHLWTGGEAEQWGEQQHGDWWWWWWWSWSNIHWHSYQQVTNTMRYDGLAREDLGAKFTCQVKCFVLRKVVGY